MISLLKKLTKKDVMLILFSVILIIGQVWLDLKSPEYMSEITKLVSTSGSRMSDIMVQGILMLLCALGSLLFAIFIGYFSSIVSSSISMTLRQELFDKVGSFGLEEVHQFSVSSLINRTTNDVANVERFIALGLHIIIKAPLLAIWAILKILGKSGAWSTLTFASIVVVLTYVLIIMLVVFPRFKIVQKQIDELNQIARENLKGIRVVRAFNAERYQEEKFNVANDILTKTQTFNQKAMSTLNSVMYIIMYLLTLGIYFLGAYLIEASSMMDKLNIFSDMIVFSTYAMQILMSFIMLILIFLLYPRVQISSKRIQEVLNTDIHIKSGKVKKTNSSLKGEIEFQNVSFHYPSSTNNVLTNLSFQIKQGETVAIIGGTGSGKSTLVQLIPRFFDVTDGAILVDGVDVRDYHLDFLHNKIGYVPQKVGMFSGSVIDNVSYGNRGCEPPSTEEVKKAIDIAQAKDFVEAMDLQYQSHIAQGGTNLSGGQKQRLSIARAIARAPEIYIFDDSFSALDYKTDFTLRKQLKEYTKDATTIIVSGRIGTVMGSDKIIVLDEGLCVGIGTHEELLKTCKVYKEIALSQIEEEEL